jgi:hypothetical protein
MDNRELTVEQLLAVANYYPGSCLCGHFESCPVCERSREAREFEHNAKLAALHLLTLAGIEIVTEVASPGFLYSRPVYKLKEEDECLLKNRLNSGF